MSSDVSILARWLRSTMSSAISGWRPRIAPSGRDLRRRRGRAGRSRPRRRAPRAGRAGREARRRPRSRRSGRRRSTATRTAPGAPAERRRRDGGRRLADCGRVGRSAAVCRASSPPSAGLHTRGRDSVPRAPAPPTERERRRDRDDASRRRRRGTSRRGSGRLARRPRLERVDDEAVAQRPVAELRRDDLASSRRASAKTSVVQAVDRRRAVGGQDRDPDRHADHPGDGHGRAAMPNDARPALSTAAVERGVTVSPNPSPNTAEDQRRPRRSTSPASSGP